MGAGKALILQAEIWSSVDSEEFLLSWMIMVYHLAVAYLNEVTTEELSMRPIRTKMLSDQGFSHVSVPKNRLKAN